MKKKTQRSLWIAAGLLAAFAVWTVLVGVVDEQPIGPLHSSVGFATLNGRVRDLIGVHMSLYTLTDWLSLIPIAVVMAFAAFGLAQLIKRRSVLRVDGDILALGAFYIAVAAAFLLFECVALNYRPVLIEGRLEASYPSSTTMLVMCVMPTAAIQLRERIKRPVIRRIAIIVIAAFTAFMVIGRVVSGVHWITDIIGGILLSAGLVTAYDGVRGLNGSKKTTVREKND